MPLYAYECNECGVRFDRRQNFDDAPITVCPECEGKVHRLIQPAGVIFKGSGFYSTDHKGAGHVATSGKTEKSSADGGSSESKSEKSSTNTADTPTTKSKASAKTDT